jgi:hypothetical protein
VRSTIERLGRTTRPFDLIRSFDDLDIEARQNPFHRALELRSLAACVSVELDQEREGAKQARHDERTAVAILDVGGMHESVHQQALRIDKDMSLLALDLLARIVAGRIDAGPPFSALLRRSGSPRERRLRDTSRRARRGCGRACRPSSSKRSNRKASSAAAGPSGRRAIDSRC